MPLESPCRRHFSAEYGYADSGTLVPDMCSCVWLKLWQHDRVDLRCVTNKTTELIYRAKQFSLSWSQGIGLKHSTSVRRNIGWTPTPTQHGVYESKVY